MPRYSGQVHMEFGDDGTMKVHRISQWAPLNIRVQTNGGESDFNCIELSGGMQMCLFFETPGDLRAFAVELCRLAMDKSTERVTPIERRAVLEGVQPA